MRLSLNILVQFVWGDTIFILQITKRCARLTSDKVYQLLAHGRWFSPGTPASSTTKTGRHDIAEILLKVVLSTINQIKSNPFISKRGPLVFVVQSHSLLTLSHVYILWKNTGPILSKLRYESMSKIEYRIHLSHQQCVSCLTSIQIIGVLYRFISRNQMNGMSAF